MAVTWWMPSSCTGPHHTASHQAPRRASGCYQRRGLGWSGMNPAIALRRGPRRLPRSELARRLAARWHLGALGCILALSAFLDLYRLGQNGYANSYYAGAVRSMLRSWHNFLFRAFVSVGLVAVGKLPTAPR